MTSIDPQPPVPPSNQLPSYIPSFTDLAKAYLLGQLAGAVPTSALASIGISGDANMTGAQQNTYWFFRIYSDIMMLGFAQNNPSYFQNTSFSTQNYLSDLQYCLTQAQASLNPPMDPAVIADVQTVLKNYSQSTMPASYLSQMIDYYNMIIKQNPPPGYESTCYDFQNLTPDATYYYYLTQIGIAVNLGQENNWASSFWQNSSGSISLMGENLGQFMCYYFYQRDGGFGNVLYSDMQNFLQMMTPIFNYVDDNDQLGIYQNLLQALFGGEDGQGNSFAGLYSDTDSMQKGAWPFPAPYTPPSGDNMTPAPFWDNPSTPNWNYTPNDPYMSMIEDELASELDSFNP